MLRKLRSRFAKLFYRDPLKHQAWEEAAKPGADGLTPFQVTTRKHVLETLDSHGATVASHQVHGTGDQERSIEIVVPALDAKVWIYLDGAEVSGPSLDVRLERWDAETPTEHYAEFSERLSELLERAS